MKKSTLIGIAVLIAGISFLYIKSQNDFERNIEAFIRSTVSVTLNEYPENIDVELKNVEYKDKNPVTNIRDHTVLATISWHGETQGSIDTVWNAATGEQFDLQVSCDGCVEENYPSTDEEVARNDYLYDLHKIQVEYLRGDISKQEAEEQTASIKANKQTYWVNVLEDEQTTADSQEETSEEDQQIEKEVQQPEEEQQIVQQPEEEPTETPQPVEEQQVVQQTEASQSEEAQPVAATKEEEPETERNNSQSTEDEPAGQNMEPLYTFDMENYDGSYKVHILSEGIKTYPSDMAWAGANVGDTIHEGKFKAVVINKENQTTTKTELNSTPMRINAERNHIFVTEGAPSILVMSETGTSNSVVAKLFSISNGKPFQITYSQGYEDFEFLEGAFQYVERNLYQIFTYSNVTGAHYMHDIRLDFVAGVATMLSENELPGEEGREIYRKWSTDPEYDFYMDQQ